MLWKHLYNWIIICFICACGLCALSSAQIRHFVQLNYKYTQEPFNLILGFIIDSGCQHQVSAFSKSSQIMCRVYQMFTGKKKKKVQLTVMYRLNQIFGTRSQLQKRPKPCAPGWWHSVARQQFTPVTPSQILGSSGFSSEKIIYTHCWAIGKM